MPENTNAAKYFSMLKDKNKEPASERSLHTKVAKYLKKEYPDVYFITDLMGEFFTKGQRKKITAQRCEMKVLDLTILEPNGFNTGLVMELKKSTEHPMKKDGNLKKDDHLEDQAKSLLHLRARGYYADFVVGYEDCVSCIDWYMNRNLDMLKQRLILK